MSYSALYRRMRPRIFSEVRGQDHIVKTLAGQIKSGRISHAYLFCGTRGTGKTTTAKIFAKAVNCLNPSDGDLCGCCDFCSLPPEDLSAVVFEIDAASNNGVDNIRDLREEVYYLPPYGKYKVYIIDEVHMLSAGAFNALLKTLEEPPEHVIFILATTEPQKIPQTVHSRCQRFDFRRISVKEIASTLGDYMKKDNSLVTGSALGYIARVADGSMRDALSLLDRCLSFFSGEEITEQKVREVLGATDSSGLFELTDALYARDSERCLELIAAASSSGRDLAFFAEEMLNHFRNLTIAASVNNTAEIFDVSEDEMSDITAQAKRTDISALMNYVATFSDLVSRMKYAANHRILLEIACIRLCLTLGAGAPVDLLERVTALEQKSANYTAADEPQPKARAAKTTVKNDVPAADIKPADATLLRNAETVNTREPEKAEAENPVGKSPDDLRRRIGNIIANWQGFAKSFSNIKVQLFLKKTEPKYVDGTFNIICDAIGILDVIKPYEQEIQKALTENGAYDIPIRCLLRQEFESGGIIGSVKNDLSDVKKAFDIK